MEKKESKILGSKGIEIYDYLTGKQINVHVDNETYRTWENKLKRRFRKNGINITPYAGFFMINLTEMVAEAFFNDAERLGINPIEYSLERTKKVLEYINKNNEKKNIQINNCIDERNKAINIVDESYTSKLQALIKTR